MPYCENCGTPVDPNVNFCGNCGTPKKQHVQPLPPPPPRMPITQMEQVKILNPFSQVVPEQILSFIIAQLSKRFGNADYYTGILTNQQLIFAPMTKEMLKEVSEISKQQAKGNLGPGPMIYPYQQRYLSMAPSAILANTPGCLVIQNSSIQQINLTVVGSIGDGYSDTNEYEMKIASSGGNFTFRMTKRDEYASRLKQIYLDKLRLR
jgi:hypothetical protein